MNTYDSCLNYIFNYLSRSLRLKKDKWQRSMISDKLFRNILNDFMQTSMSSFLVFSISQSGQLFVNNKFPILTLYHKGVYVIKSHIGPIDKIDYKNQLIIGDLSEKLLDQHEFLINDIFGPLLIKYSEINNEWPLMLQQDFQKKLYNLRNVLFQVRGQIEGLTILSMPIGFDDVAIFDKNLDEFVEDLFLKSSIESTVSKWSKDISEIISTDSSDLVETNTMKTTPQMEIQFWKKRLTNLQNILKQLHRSEVETMGFILEKSNSAYFINFQNIFETVQKAFEEAKDLVKYLEIFELYLNQMENLEFEELYIIIKPLTITLCLLWTNCKYFTQNRFILFAKQLGNLLIINTEKYLDVNTLFHSEPDDAIERLNICLKLLQSFYSIFNDIKCNIRIYFPNNRNTLDFHVSLIFDNFQKFVKRLELIKWFFETVLELQCLEKLQFGGMRAKYLNRKVEATLNESRQTLQTFSSKNYAKALNLVDVEFYTSFNQLRTILYQTDIRILTIIKQGFLDCSNFEYLFKYLLMIEPFLNRDTISNGFLKDYVEKLQSMLQDHLISCDEIFQLESNEKCSKFLTGIPFQLTWINGIIKRLMIPFNAINLSTTMYIGEKLKHVHDYIYWDLFLTHFAFYEKNKNIFIHYQNLLCKFETYKIAIYETSIDNSIEIFSYDINSHIIKQDKYFKINSKLNLNNLINSIKYIDKYFNLKSNVRNILLKSDAICLQYSIFCNLVNKFNKAYLNQKDTRIENLVNELWHLLSEETTKIFFNSNETNIFLNNLSKKLNDFENSTTLLTLEHEKNIKLISKWDFLPLYIRDIETNQIDLFNIDQVKNYRFDEIKNVINEFQDIYQYKDVLNKHILQTIGYSLSYLIAEMNPLNFISPLVEISFDFLNNNIITYPDILNDSNCNNFNCLMQQVVNNIIDMKDLFCCLDDICKNENIITLQNILNKTINKGYENIKIFYKTLDEQYRHLWLNDKSVHLNMFLTYGKTLNENDDDFEKRSPKLEDFDDKITFYKNVQSDIEKLKNRNIIDSWIQVNITALKMKLLEITNSWKIMFYEKLETNLTKQILETEKFVNTVQNQFYISSISEDDYDTLVTIMQNLFQIKNKEDSVDELFIESKKVEKYFANYEWQIPCNVVIILEDLEENWLNLMKQTSIVKQIVKPLQQKEAEKISMKTQRLGKLITEFQKVFQNSPLFDYTFRNCFHLIDLIHFDIKKFESDLKNIKQSCLIFEIPVYECDILKQCRRNLFLLKELWGYYYVVNSVIDYWKMLPWQTIDVEMSDMECKRFIKELSFMEKETRHWNLFISLDMFLKNILISLKIIGELQNNAIRERHWRQLFSETQGLQSYPLDSIVAFVMNPNTLLGDMIKFNLHTYEDEIKNLQNRAIKEMTMEKFLIDLNSTWINIKIKVEKEPKFNYNLIKFDDEIVNILEDHLVQLQIFLTSKYIKYFFQDFIEWQKKLLTADQVINLWTDFQKVWFHLQSIFIHFDDIQKQLKDDCKRFHNIHEKFMDIINEQLRLANEFNYSLLTFTQYDNLLDTLSELRIEMQICEKALAQYLDTKRLQFPRFYFISSSDLLELLSKGGDPKLVAKHLSKLFDSISDLCFNEFGDINGMKSTNESEIYFDEIIHCSKQVEDWLCELEKSMRKVLKKLLENAIGKYNNKSRELWLLDYPSQIALCGSQVWWTHEVGMAFKKIEEGYDNALKDYQRKQIQQLNVLINLLLKDLSVEDRQKIMVICTVDVHARDVVQNLIQAKIQDVSAFQWQSQLRYIWNQQESDCFVHICDANFRYSYEYLGNNSRLVITPLTDRCYITLTQSLHLALGGSPSGPAGTGKTETTKDLGRALGIMVYVFNCSEQMDYKNCGNIYKGLAQTGAWGCFDEFNRIAVEVLSVIAVQVKCILTAIRQKDNNFNFMGENISLIPTIGIFVTMNPNYAGRTELPENLKSLFRPCAMVVPDIELICEIMLVTEGFQSAKILAKKFITLYSLCKELLSKQDHYDWGLRAIKSVLVVAGALKREDSQRPEEEVLMRVLRDFNLPKIVVEDVPIFIGLIDDLFPALDVPRKRILEFERKIKQATTDLRLQPEDSFILKVTQLQEILNVRHSVFIIGNAGTGKTQIWKTLFKYYKNCNMNPVFDDLNPKAVTTDELFGAVDTVTREWKDGLFSSLMRKHANIADMSPKWIILDGDIDPMWIESLNTVMDDNKVLTLANNERISLISSMRLIFEISHLKYATPATVSRAGILYVNTHDLGWNSIATSWIEKKTNENEQSVLMNLFDQYIPKIIECIRLDNFKKIIPILEISHIQMLCDLLDCFLKNNIDLIFYEIYFVFACVWSFGSTISYEQNIDNRVSFSKWWIKEFTNIKFPIDTINTTVFDFYIDKKQNQFVPWFTNNNEMDIVIDKPLQTILIQTSESIRIKYFLELFIENKMPMMLVGNSGCGKTLLMNEKLNENQFHENHLVSKISFNYYTNSFTLQKILEQNLEKKSGKKFGPIGNKSLIYFIDDLNVPQADLYGTVQAHTLIRQYFDYKHWYDRSNFTIKEIFDCSFLVCMNPTIGSFTISPRLQRHFKTFAINFPNFDSLLTIYKTILKTYLYKTENGFSSNIRKLSDNIVEATISLHHKVTQVFIPTAIKFHYIFNLRDISNVFQGFLFADNECLNHNTHFLRLWIHETSRAFGDKLINSLDIIAFKKIQQEILKKHFDDFDEKEVFKTPNIYCHFAKNLNEIKYMPVESWDHIKQLLNKALDNYNELISAMNLVFFEEAIIDICKIVRILETPRANALLIGVGGSGKQSLTRLAAFITNFEIFQIQLTNEFNVNDFKKELSQLFLKTGLKSINVLLLMTDAHIPNDNFLVIISDMLSTGEVSEIFTDDEIDNIINYISNEVKGTGLSDTRENCWKTFINRVRSKLKIVLCFSPVGSTLKNRVLKFPSLINYTVINWFHEWPEEALISVSKKFLEVTDMVPNDIKDSIARFMSFVHKSTLKISQEFIRIEKRYNFLTPKTFLMQIELYRNLVKEKSNEINYKTDRLKSGLEKLRSATTQVDKLKIQLAEQELVLKMKNEAADKLIQSVEIETKKIKAEKILADQEQAKVEIINTEVTQKQKECEDDLKQAEPALFAAQEALNTLNKANLTELKSFGAPPTAVTNVTSAVIVLLAIDGRIPKDRSWKAAKLMMAKVDYFLDSLVKYDKENIHPEIIKAIQSYLNDPEFEPEFIKSKSAAAAGLCSWVINIVKFYEVYCDVKPKRAALEEANLELQLAQKKLKLINDKVESLENQLKELTAEYDKAFEEKQRCQQEADNTSYIINLANRLINGLSNENIRWAEAAQNLENQKITLPGDILLVTAFITYTSYFSKIFREKLQNIWNLEIRKMKPTIPVSNFIDVVSILVDEKTAAEWNNEGLPSDRMSLENAAIITNSIRWPLLVDPQLQGVKWIKKKFSEQLQCVKFNQKNYLTIIEEAVCNGSIILIENIGETIDPILDTLIGKNFIKKGKCIKIGDKEIDYNTNFRLILQTKILNPYFKPELQAQTCLVNFIVTKIGLEEQFLTEIVKFERPDLDDLKTNLTKQQNDFRIMITNLENNLLVKLSDAGENILADRSLVENLENTKKTAVDIEQKAKECMITSNAIDETRELYRLAATRAFSVVFFKSLNKAVKSLDVSERVLNLMNSITLTIYEYTIRGLFECDKLIFSSQITFQILLSNNKISVNELDCLLQFPTNISISSPVTYLSDNNWGAVCYLSSKDDFKNLNDEIENDTSNKWKTFVESEYPECEKMPFEWKNKSSVQKLCILRALRPDRMINAITLFISENLGENFVKSDSKNFEKYFEESTPSTPIFFILSPGVNPLKDVEIYAERLGFNYGNKKLYNISLGQAQEEISEEYLDISSKEGNWLILQNIHLVRNWLPRLEKKFEQVTSNAHKDFRLFMTSEPTNIIPKGLLDISIKVTNEPPSGIKANLHKVLDNFNENTIEKCSREIEYKAILFALCYFHVVISERKKFGAIGWNKTYPFNNGDLLISASVLHNYLEINKNVPWEDLRYLFGQIMYGGHITDNWDRRLCIAYLEEYLKTDLFNDYQFAPGFRAPPNLDYTGYHEYVDQNLPTESPLLYGLPVNIQLSYLKNLSDNLFKTIYEMQPVVSEENTDKMTSREDKVKHIIDEMLEKLPEEFNMIEIMKRIEERTPYTIVALQECERMNYLTEEIRKSLKEIDLGLKGELTITMKMEEMQNSLFLGQIPKAWLSKAYPSLYELGFWFSDLLLRIKQLDSWTSDFLLPSSIWLGGLFNPQSLLTAIMQTTAKKFELPLDTMSLHAEVTNILSKDDISAPPENGANIHGLFIEGAEWDMKFEVITEVSSKDIITHLPVIHLRSTVRDKLEMRNMYECPVYKTRARGDTYVWSFHLKTHQKPSKWILTGTAILLQN